MERKDGGERENKFAFNPQLIPFGKHVNRLCIEREGTSLRSGVWLQR